MCFLCVSSMFVMDLNPSRKDLLFTLNLGRFFQFNSILSIIASTLSLFTSDPGAQAEGRQETVRITAPTPNRQFIFSSRAVQRNKKTFIFSQELTEGFFYGAIIIVDRNTPLSRQISAPNCFNLFPVHL